MDNSVRQPFGYLCSPTYCQELVSIADRDSLPFGTNRPRRRNRHAPKADRDDPRKPNQTSRCISGELPALLRLGSLDRGR
jgi:hypothetical protein